METILMNIQRHKLSKQIKEPSYKKHFKTNKINYIHSVVLKLFEIYFAKNSIELKNYLDLTEIMVFQYLLFWLENDESCSRNICDFCSRGYFSERISSEDDDIYINSEKQTNIIRMYDALVVYNHDHYFQNNVLNNYIRKDDMCDVEETSEIQTHNFLKLAFLDMYSNNYLELYKLLFLRKNKLEIKKRAKNDDALVEAYENFDKFIEKINTAKSDVEYVVLNMLYYKLEYTYRFNFARELAIFLKDKGLDEHTQIPRTLLDIIQNCEVPIYNNGRNVLLFCPSPFIYNYKEAIKKHFLYVPDEKEDLSYIRKARNIVNDIYVLLIDILPIKELGSWTRKDFSDAKSFIENHFSDSLYLYTSDISKTEKRIRSYADYIRSIYSNPDFIDQNLWEKGRSNLKSMIKEYNKQQHQK